MSRKHKSIGEVQDQILNQFRRDIRSYETRHKSGNLSAVEQAIEDGRRNRERMEEIKKKSDQKPFISFYNPNNPLNGFKYKSKEEQQRIMKALKAQEKAKNVNNF